jgi:transcriptional regulator with PAS, ATPase and Fis domain
MPIALPPLRERRGDVPLLASYFIDHYNREFKRRIRGLTPAVTKLIDQYHWPGNIRELRNTIERAMLLATHEWLEPTDFTGLAHPATAPFFSLPADGVKLEELERQLLMQALERTGGNQSKAAELIGLNRDQVRYRIEKFGLQLA